MPHSCAARLWPWPALVAAVACGPTPAEVVERAIEHPDGDHLALLIADDYADALGGRAELLEDAAFMEHAFARIGGRASELSTATGASRLEADVAGRLDLVADGDIGWRVTGPLDMRLRSSARRFRILSGWLTDFRDVMRLMDARRRALEANDAEAYGRLLHPTYRDGDTTLEETKSKIRSDLKDVRVRLRPSLYKLEVRGPTAHIDEHYILEVNGRTLPAQVARFTLARAGGRWRIASGLYP